MHALADERYRTALVPGLASIPAAVALCAALLTVAVLLVVLVVVGHVCGRIGAWCGERAVGVLATPGRRGAR
ncbi:hypothetical protein MBEHAL_1029 [Halarchaeum acidiphilum MH1-52-1]|uniref:Uncharacterized protein n=1 Tax=Halarchaeum acidiphilum MH1-52-1 TaxID=1261545 RepID=U3A3P5_9EURY|nr:hypothetical protein MBEHAL_1029 [Halarchaeum acidiphilum MH1-52-1]